MVLRNSPDVILKGLNTVMSNLNKEIEKIKDRSLQGLLLGTAIIRRDMDKTAPLIPVDTGNLRSSWFTVTAKSKIGNRNNPSFKGDRAAEMTKEHASTLAKYKAAALGVNQIVVIMGFSANYGMWVHEMLGGDIKWNREQSGPRFFQTSIDRNGQKVLEVIRKTATIK